MNRVNRKIRFSVHDSNYNLRNLRNLDQIAQPSAARSVLLNNSGNICGIGSACVAIYNLRFPVQTQTLLFLGIPTVKPCKQLNNTPS